LLTFSAILALLGASYWLYSAWSCLRMVRAMPVLEKLSPEEPGRWPRLTLVIAARNEATDMEAALESRLGEGYPDLELVVVNDRSTDATGEILDRVAARDRRVTPMGIRRIKGLVEGPEVGAGW